MWQSHWENAQAAAEGLLSALLWLGTDWEWVAEWDSRGIGSGNGEGNVDSS